ASHLFLPQCFLLPFLLVFASSPSFSFFFFNDPATTEIYTLSTRRSSDLVSRGAPPREWSRLYGNGAAARIPRTGLSRRKSGRLRSEEHTSELQSRRDLVCRLLLEKKKKSNKT